MIPSGAFEISIGRFLSPIQQLLGDEKVSEIMINGHKEIWIERGGVLELTETRFPSRHSLEAALINISQFAGRPLNRENPILEAHLPDGSRIEAVLEPIAKDGPSVAIRRFSKSTLTVDKLVTLGSLSSGGAKFLKKVVAQKYNVIVSGGTGSGKTSLLGALSAFAGDGERIVVIEDTHELQVQKKHVVYLEARSADEKGEGRVTIRDLLSATLRLRPDRILVGEVRGAETLDLVQAMTSGHGGSMTSVHAKSPADGLRRLETMAQMSDADLPLSALRAQVASAVDFVVQAERTPFGKRQVCDISHVQGLSKSGDYVVRRCFARNRAGEMVPVAQSKKELCP